MAPFYNIVLEAQKPLSEAYPNEIITTGDHIRKRRLDLKLFQKEVAEFVGTTEETIYHWESNRNYPTIRYWPKIIEFLGYDPEFKPGNSLAATIWNYRRKNGISQPKLAKLIGVDPSTVFWWENGKPVKFRRSKEQLRKFFQEEWIIEFE